MDNFKIIEVGDKHVIHHLAFPRFSATIAFNSPSNDLEDIKMLDNCYDASLIARIMREAGEYIFNFQK